VFGMQVAAQTILFGSHNLFRPHGTSTRDPYRECGFEHATPDSASLPLASEESIVCNEAFTSIHLLYK
jgi:hypothetical protein